MCQTSLLRPLISTNLTAQNIVSYQLRYHKEGRARDIEKWMLSQLAQIWEMPDLSQHVVLLSTAKLRNHLICPNYLLGRPMMGCKNDLALRPPHDVCPVDGESFRLDSLEGGNDGTR